MSYFDDASLVMIPSGYKTSKVYSVKPTSGDGDLTFTRSNDTATRVGPDGLIEKVRTNLITYSQDFSNAAWVTNNSTKTTSQTDPNSGTTAVKIVSTANVNSGIYQTKTASSTTRTASLWMKGETGGEVVEYGDATNRATATLTTSWVRYSFAATDASAFFVIYNQTSAPAIQTWYVAFVQYENGDIATDYIATTTAAVSVGPVANVPRLDYLNSSCPRLLLEPQRTNLNIYSEDFTNATWDKLDLVTTNYANVVVSPDGYTNADKLIPNTTSAQYHGLQLSSGRPSLTAGTVYTYSIFAKAEGYDKIRIQNFSQGIRAQFNLTTGALINQNGTTSTFITSYGNGWYRIGFTYTQSTTQSSFWNILVVSTDDNSGVAPIAWAGNGTDAIAVWGSTIEAGAYATSYIPTLGAAVTRGADAASKTGISSLLGTEGTWFVELDPYSVSTSTSAFKKILGIFKTNGSVADAIYIEEYLGNWGVWVRKGGSTITSTGYVAQPTKVAVTFGASGSRIYFDGIQKAVIATDTSNDMTQISTTATAGGGIESVLNLKQMVYIPSILTPAQLAELTTL